MNLKKGLIVKASAGRDRNMYFAVIETDGSFVMLADGKSRKLACPKRKNIKHIRPTSEILCIDGMTDKKLRRALSEFSESGGEYFV